MFFKPRRHWEKRLSAVALSALVSAFFMVFLLLSFALADQSTTSIIAANGQQADAGDGAATAVIPQQFTNHLGMTFVYIKPGTFMMGSPPDEPGRTNDEEQHQVSLEKGFYIQTTEVTQGQWLAIMDENPSYFKDCGANCPVERVSWEKIQVFIEKLNSAESLRDQPAPLAPRRYCLPTEAEWEYACRAGSHTAFADGEIEEVACGPDPMLNAMGWYCGNAGNTTHPVAQKAPNAWGLYDMHGNVFEWTQDTYDYKTNSSVVVFLNGDWSGYQKFWPVPISLRGRIVRGGSWKSQARFCRSAHRDQYSQYPTDFYNRYLGFRLVARINDQTDKQMIDVP